ncbi:MAG: putative porin [Bacteroidota bacterium]
MRKILILPFFILILRVGVAQILDDSTELAYGPKTTQFVHFDEILNNQQNYKTLDTSLYQYDRKFLVDQNSRRFQDLGSHGTALFPVFYDLPQTIGRTSGFNAYRPYFRGTQNIRFYDTKSPFIDLLVYFGGGNQNIVDIDFSRNVREGWNVGFDLHNITTDKQLANNGEADRQVVATAFDFYTHYQNNKVPYQALFYFSNTSHKVVELGGVRFATDSTLEELFEFDNALLRRLDAQNVVRNDQWHLYHDYQVADQFQLYHTLDYTVEENTYQDSRDPAVYLGDYDTYSDAYNGVFLLDADSTNERATFTSFSNEVGIKGDLGSVFYRAYLKLRSVNFRYFLLDPVPSTSEAYLGGYARLNWKEKFKLIGEGELLQGGEYQFKGQLSSDFLHVTYRTMKYNVPFIYNSYFGNHFQWTNSFTPVFVNQIEGDLSVRYKAFTFIPKVSFTAYNDFIFFDEDRTPSQASGGIAIASAGGAINFGVENKKGEGLFLENEVVATSVSGGAANAIRIPELFYNGRYYWKGLLFDDKVPVEVGVDVHARSTYFANGYEAVTQQFFLQNELETTGYLKTDFFFNMRLDKFFIGLKWQYFNQPSDGGYFATPFFPGQPSVLDLIVKWSFFD